MFIKKILILKPIDRTVGVNKATNGIVRIECENGVADFFLSLVNLPDLSSAKYYGIILDGQKRTYLLDLGVRPKSISQTLDFCPDLSQLGVAVFAVKNDIPINVVLATSEQSIIPVSEIKKAVAEKCLYLKNKKNPLEKEKPNLPETDFPEPSPIKPPYPPAPAPDPEKTPDTEFNACDYDDEAVATTDYYALDREIETKLKTLENIYDCRSTENELPNNECKEKTPKERSCTSCAQNAPNTLTCPEVNLPYYLSVRKELDGLFNDFPHESDLERNFYGSRFVKINYSKEKFYVVGLIPDSENRKYICYGVPSTYSPTPPKALKGYCSFIPLSIFDMKGKGYWMMFQDGATGDCVHLDK